MPSLTRILLTVETRAGLWRYSLDLARGLLRAGVEPVLAVMGPEPDSMRAHEALVIDGLRLIATGLPAQNVLADAATLREAGAALAGLAGRMAADTVHLHTPILAAEVPWPVPVVAVAHDDVGTWWQSVHGGALPEQLAWRAEAMARGLAEADAAVSPSRGFARALSRLYRPGRSLTVVPYGRSRIILPPSRRRPAVLAAGRLWDEGKNIAVLDRAAERLDAPVFAAGRLIGPGGVHAEFARLRCLGLLSAPALAARMAEATVFVAPSRHEPFGTAVLEAAQAGMALALSDIPTFREFWDGAALFFHPEDAGGLTDVLNRLLARPEAAAARARREGERFTAAAMVAATLALHRELVGTPESPSQNGAAAN